jgi:glycosyltransferase involved in cell wall biosynthesis
MKYRLSVIIPVYNEEENLEHATASLVELLEKACADYEVIIVDSASTDRTGDIAQRMAALHPKVKNIRQKARKGFGNGLREGYANATMDYVWYVDADLPYDLDNLVKALPFFPEYDAVIGYKTGRRENAMRWVMSFVYNRFIRLVLGLKYRDINYSFKIVKRDVLDKLKLEADGWFVTVELLTQLQKKGYKVKEMLVPFIMRAHGQSKVSNYSGTIMYFIRETFKYKRKLKLMSE